MSTVLSDTSTGNFWAYAGWGAHSGYITTNVRTTVTQDTIGTKVTSIKYMRSIYILIQGVGLKPYSTQTPWFDGIDVSKWTAPLTDVEYEKFKKEIENSGYAYDGKDSKEELWKSRHGEPIKADREGKMWAVFRIPPSTFECGTTILKFTDDSANSTETTFTSSGELTTTFNKITTNVKVTLSDPVGQSFHIQLPSNVQGCYITAVGVWFKTISTTANLYLEIRNMANGTIGEERIAVVAVNPRATMDADGYVVKTSEVGADGDETKIPLPNPVYLDNNKSYAFVLRTNSKEYNVWGARMGEGRYDKDEAVETQPNIGCMFKSSNNETWEADQWADLKFKIYRAKFKTNPATGGVDAIVRSAILPPPSRSAFRTYIQTYDNSQYFRVFAINHGLYEGSKVIVKFKTQGSLINGIPALEFNGKVLDVVAVDSTSFVVSTNTATTFTSTGGINGDEETLLGKKYYTHYAWMDYITYYPNISTDILYLNQVNTAFAGTEIKNDFYPTYLTPMYGKPTDGEYNKYEIINNTEFQTVENVAFPSFPEMKNRLDYPRYPSYIITRLHSDHDYMSPQISLDGMCLVTAVLNFNNPARDAQLNLGDKVVGYENETDTPIKDCYVKWMANHEAGRNTTNALMKYQTSTVTMENEATALKIIFAGNITKDNYVSVFYRTLSSSENIDITEKDWVCIPWGTELTKKDEDEPIKPYPFATEIDEYYDYDYEVNGQIAEKHRPSPFIKYQVKLVCWGDDKAVPVKIKDFRAVALAR